MFEQATLIYKDPSLLEQHQDQGIRNHDDFALKLASIYVRSHDPNEIDWWRILDDMSPSQSLEIAMFMVNNADAIMSARGIWTSIEKDPLAITLAHPLVMEALQKNPEHALHHHLAEPEYRKRVLKYACQYAIKRAHIFMLENTLALGSPQEWTTNLAAAIKLRVVNKKSLADPERKVTDIYYKWYENNHVGWNIHDRETAQQYGAMLRAFPLEEIASLPLSSQWLHLIVQLSYAQYEPRVLLHESTYDPRIALLHDLGFAEPVIPYAAGLKFENIPLILEPIQHILEFENKKVVDSGLPFDVSNGMLE